jgi:hypothetical protein
MFPGVSSGSWSSKESIFHPYQGHCAELVYRVEGRTRQDHSLEEGKVHNSFQPRLAV